MKKIIKVGYAIPSIAMIIVGLVYLTSKQPMPYHIEAMDVEWEKLPKDLKTIILNFMESVGAGFICMGISVLTILFNTFEIEKKWMLIAIPLIFFSELLVVSYTTIDTKLNTNGNPPLLPLLVLLSISLATFVIHLLSYKRKSKNN